MDGREELIFRLSLKRRRKLGSLSDEAFAELELAVREDPMGFVDNAEEAAFARVVAALDALYATSETDEFLDDEQFLEARQTRLATLVAHCKEALSLDEGCVDARLLTLLATIEDSDALLDGLMELDGSLRAERGPVEAGATGDAWSDVFARPRLRLMAQLAQTCLYTARYRLCRERCLELLDKAPLDALGARLTLALALARLEDEEGFNTLEKRGGGHGNAWYHLGRVILMYKLGRTGATRRALLGYDRLCQGGAYALLQPHFVDTYLPDRPSFVPGSFEEAMLAVHEADPIVADTPDLCSFASTIPDFLSSAQAFCEQNGLDWRDQ